MQEEMRLAHKIQAALLPHEPPDVPGYDVSGKSISATAGGGDYYDFLKAGEDRWILCLGDVAGKGMPAALLMANVQATLRSQILRGLSPADCLEQSNSLVLKSTDPDRFATAFFGALDVREHILCYSNAGHNPPMLFRPGTEPVSLEAGGTILGCFEGSCYDEDRVGFRAGDVLVIYSDGISEAANEAGEQFGEARICDTAMAHIEDSTEDLLIKLTEAAGAHAGTATPADDMTVMVVKRKT
jgi:sigma-B regulation protein RsbU (phosphoserine phosphatase)